MGRRGRSSEGGGERTVRFCDVFATSIDRSRAAGHAKIAKIDNRRPRARVDAIERDQTRERRREEGEGEGEGVGEDGI